MANHTKAEAAEKLKAAGISQRSFSPSQFCARHGISESMFRQLKKLGKAPREIKVLDRILITTEAEDEWLAARAAETTAA